jgi:5-methylcytosine-specific restriction endonuclease McrA
MIRPAEPRKNRRYVHAQSGFDQYKARKRNLWLRDGNFRDKRGTRWAWCAYCNIFATLNSLTIDHVHPWRDGGSWDLHNLLLACEGCNHKKAKKSFLEFLREIV